MAFGTGAAIYFLYKLITTYPLTFIGIMLGSPLGPMGMLAGGFIGFIGDKIVGGLKGAVSSVANTSAIALETAVSLPANAAAAPLGFATVAVPVIGPIIITFIAAWIAISTFFSAFSLSSVATVEKGMPMSTFTQLEEVKDFPYEESADDLLASEIAQIAEDCVSGIVNKDTWEQFKECLENSLIDGKVKERVIQELNHSVNELPDNENLQCVGFVLAAFPDKNLPHQNAVDFLYNYGDLQKNTIPQKGDIAVWGPYPDKCSASPGDASDYCEANSSCCGHVGIVNKVEGNNVYVTSAWGESGIINTVKFSSTSDEKPWTYLR